MVTDGDGRWAAFEVKLGQADVKTHVAHIYPKLDIANRSALTAATSRTPLGTIDGVHKPWSNRSLNERMNGSPESRRVDRQQS